MAVALRDRKINDFTLLGKCEKLLAEVVRVVKCGKKFPKRQISTFGNPIVDDFRKLAHCVAIANQYDLYDETAARREFQDQARQHVARARVDVNTLAAISDQAISTMSQAVLLLDEVEKLLKAWMRSDESRLQREAHERGSACAQQ